MNGTRVHFTKEDIGAEILPILTTGLYRNTLDALREYIQNAVDAEANEIQLVVDPDVVSLTDDGTGMDGEQARNAIRFGVSDKSPLENVGFRGIGIYSGFNICDSLEVYTKESNDGNTYRLTFDFYGIRTKLLKEQERRSKGLPPALHLERLLEQSVFMESLGDQEFRRVGTTVIMSGLLPNAYAQINDWDQVANYLRDVVPLPFSPEFRYGKVIEERFVKRDYRVIPLTLQLGGQQATLYRPYTDALFKFGGRHEPEFFDIKGTKKQEFGFAWACVNDARETIKDITLRGLLLKKFGFSISDRQYLEPFFGRPTYSRRITGEVILTNERLIPNAARNDFEHNSTRQDFVAQLPQLTRAIDRWANKIQESERAREVLARTTQQLVEINDALPLLQRDRDRLLEYNAKISEITRQMSPHRRRLENLDPDGLSLHKELAEGASRLVKAALARNRRTTRKLETEVSKAVQREAAARTSRESVRPTEAIGIFSLVERYLPLDETKWLAMLKILDEVIQGQQLEPDVYQAIVDTLREELDVRL